MEDGKISDSNNSDSPSLSLENMIKRLDNLIKDLESAYDQIDSHYDLEAYTGKSKDDFLKEFYDETRYVDKVVEMCDIKEKLPNTYEHCLRTALESKMFVDNALENEDFYIDGEQKSGLYTAALIHDYKKKDVDNEAVNRKGPLSQKENAEMKTHSHAREEIEKNVLNGDGLDQDMLEMVIDIVQGHHPGYGTELQNGFGQILIASDCLDAGKIREQYQPSHSDDYFISFFETLVNKNVLKPEYIRSVMRLLEDYGRHEAK